MWREKLIASVFASSSEPILVVERASRKIMDCNAATESLFGWPRAELIGKPTAVIAANQEHWRSLVTQFFPALDAGETADLRMEGLHRDGHNFPCRVRAKSFSHDGAEYHVIYIQDLTEFEKIIDRSRRESAALAERVKELRAIYRISDTLSKTDISLDERLSRIPAELKAAWQFPEHAHAWFDVRGRRYSTVGYTDGVARQSAEIRVMGHPVGEVTVSYDRSFPEADDGPFLDEERTLLDDVALRIGEAVARHDDDAERRRSEARLRFMSDNLPLTIAVSDWETGTCLYLNPYARREIGIDLNDPIDHLNIADFYADPDDRGKTRAQLERDGKIQDFQLRVRINGNVRSTILYAETIEFEGRKAVYIVRLDVTELREAEEALRRSQRLDAIGQLAGGIAHDFNNVLTALSMQFELLGEEPGLSASARKGIEIASSAVDRGAAVTRQLLSFARKTELRPDRADIGALVVGMQAFLARTLGGHVRVAVEKPNAPVWAYLDEGLFENAVLNLAINARDAMPAGGNLKIAVSDRRVAPEEGRMSGTAAGRYVEVAVTDTGTGMTPEVLDRVFEPFFTTKDVGHGTGLGLSMVHGFVKQSGGFAKIESAPGLGTTVRLFFPHREEAAAAAEARRDTAVPRGHERILLVDDDDLVRQSIAQQLRAHGYSVMVAQGGAEALRLLDEARPELLISDVMMPGMLGTSLAEEVRMRMPSLPILIVSGSYESDHRQTLRPLSPIDFCEKPFAFSALAQKVRRLLDSSIPPAKEHR